MLNYNKLKYFTVVAYHQNITKAAEKLYIGQPSLSTHMKELEKELGVNLFARTSNCLRLTDAGQTLYNQVAPFFDNEKNLIRMVREVAQQETSRIKIGTLGANIIYQLPDIISGFQKECDSIKVDVQLMNKDELSTALKSHKIDIGFKFVSDMIGESRMPGFKYYTIKRGSVLIAMSRNHPLSKKKRIKLSDLKDCRFAIQDRRQAFSPYNFLLKKCRKAGFQPNIAVEYTFVEPILTAIGLGNMVAVLSDLAPLKGHEDVCCVCLEEGIPIELDMIWDRSKMNTAIHLFVKCIKKRF